MGKTFKEKVISFFTRIGKKHRLLKTPSIMVLSVMLFLYYTYIKLIRGWKRYACTIFLFVLFLVGNSFSYPVFQDNGGFIYATNKTQHMITRNEESAMMPVSETVVNQDEPVLRSGEDVLEDYDDAELHGVEELDKYSLDEILEENSSFQEVDQSVEMLTEDAVFNANDWRLILINKQHPIPDDYTFTLGTIKGSMQCDERIIFDLLGMLQGAKNDGVNLVICSPYRDLERQEVLFNRKITAYMNKGMSYMEAYMISSKSVTVPGASEHQIGLAIDIISNTYSTLDTGFAETEAGKWLADHCYEYGFILRYPQDKEYITGIEFEPWHFRYVGKEAAAVIWEQGITLEEFVESYL